MLHPLLLKNCYLKWKKQNRILHIRWQWIQSEYIGIFCLVFMHYANNNYQSKRQRSSLSGARITRPTRDFLGPFSASITELPAVVDSCGLALEDCAVIRPWGMQFDKLFAKLLEALFGLRWILFLRSWAPVPVFIRYEHLIYDSSRIPRLSHGILYIDGLVPV